MSGNGYDDFFNEPAEPKGEGKGKPALRFPPSNPPPGDTINADFKAKYPDVPSTKIANNPGIVEAITKIQARKEEIARERYLSIQAAHSAVEVAELVYNGDVPKAKREAQEAIAAADHKYHVSLAELQTDEAGLWGILDRS